MADVFISYCRAGTSNLARQIAQRLDELGISCWYDTKSVNVGGIADFITREIQDCKVFLLLLDESANASSYVFAEVNASFPLYGKQITPVPVQIGRFARADNLKFYLGAYNILFYDSPEAVPAEELARQIVRVLSLNPDQPQQIQTPQPHCTPNPLQLSGKIIKKGKCGNNVIYTLDENGQLLISGIGRMWDYPSVLLGFRNFPWDYWRRYMTSHVHIQSGVTSIGKNAFWRSYNLESVSIPDSVTFIGSGAFTQCYNLKSVSIPANAIIADDAFDPTTEVIRRPAR